MADLPIMPSSWADLAEDDPEMQLMGPPPHLPNTADPEWIIPRKTARKRTQVPITPFLTQQNQFTVLRHQLAPDEDASKMREVAPEVAAAIHRAWDPVPSPSEPETCHSEQLVLPSSTCP